MSEKLQKVLANAGYASRREIEKWIDAGRVTVNGKRAKLGIRVEPTDYINVDGKPARGHAGQQHETQIKALIYHKPEGQICTQKDNKGRPTVFENLPAIANGRWVAVGRLDLNTSGLLLFTNNGELANKLMHPSTELEREYLARVRGQLSEEEITLLCKTGVTLDGKKAHFDSVTQANLAEDGSNHWYRVVMREGRYREVRRLFEFVGHEVSRLKRIRYGTVKLTRDLKRGKVAQMAPKQLEKLVASAGLASEFATQLYSHNHSNGHSSKHSNTKGKRSASRKPYTKSKSK